MSIFNVILGILLILNYLCVISLIFVERKRPSATVVWVVLLIFLPIVSFFLYLAFGSGLRLRKKKRFNIKAERYKQYQLMVKEILELPDKIQPYGFVAAQKRLGSGRPMYELAETDIEDGKALLEAERESMGTLADGTIQYLHRADQSLYTIYNDVEIFTDGEDKFQKLMNDIRGAKSTINILYYKINSDQTGREFVKLLTEKAKEGVEIRILYDSLGSFSSTRKMFRELEKAGGQVTAFFPVHLAFTSYLRLNYRNHRKIVVIDSEIGYVGGMNIGDEYRGMDKKLSPWRDTHLRVRGLAVLLLQERFFMDWMDANEDHNINLETASKFYRMPEKCGKVAVQIASSGPDTENEEIKRSIIKLLTSATDYVYLQTPYFIPDSPLLEAMKIAAFSGVDVRLMLPAISDFWFVQYASLSYIDELIKAGVKCYMYNGFLHAKMVVADDKVATIGSTNLDIRSFSLDFEVNAFMYCNDFAGKCRDIFMEDMSHCFEATAEWRSQKSVVQRALEGIVRIFSPIM